MRGLYVGLVNVLLLACAVETVAVPVQWSSTSSGSDHYYEVFVDSTAPTWQAKYEHSLSQGGYLVTITSADENQFVFNLCNSLAYWFTDRFGFFRGPTIGGIQASGSSEPDGGWGWVTGEPFVFTAWAPGQPNNVQGQDRIEYWNATSIAPTWQDVSQSELEPGISWIVEYDVSPVGLLPRTWGAVKALYTPHP